MKLAWHSALLLPLALLPVVVTEAQTCSNGLAGYEASSVCCPLSCGQCGGSGCSRLGEGCCTGGVKASGDLCSVTRAAPCNIDGDIGSTPEPTPAPEEDEVCTAGVPGILKDEFCCPNSCGSCTGSGCGARDGGAGFTGGEACCGSGIISSGRICSAETGAPCIVADGSTPEPTPAPVGDEVCAAGVPGILKDEFCCPNSCGSCTGSGCGARNGGAGFTGGEACCGSGIISSGRICSAETGAPCIVADGSTPEPTPAPMEDQVCAAGVPGILKGEFCCPNSCGSCTGSGCSARNGGAGFTGGEACCGSGIISSGRICSAETGAPCIVADDEIVTPEPTVTPTSTMTSPPVPTPAPVDTPGNFDEIESYLVTPPTRIMTIPDDPSGCTTTTTPKFRFAASSGLVGRGRLYAESPGCFTMTDIYNWRGTVSSGGVLSSKGPIFQLDDSGSVVENVNPIGGGVTNKWLLTAELYVTNGAIFYCKGTEVGGDCDELRIQSTGPFDYYELRGHGGSLYFESTIVTSWDTPNKVPQEVHEDGRSFVNCVSEKLTGETCVGAAKDDRGECRMDMINSEMAYLGFFESESYGITWKVRGFCVDLSNHDVFTTTNVYGDIKGCDIHHNYYGHYSYGHQGGVWTNNKMHDNWQYGFDPHDDSDYLTIAHNEVYNNINHGIIASKRCNNVTIHDNKVSDGGAQAVGIFLHRSSDNAKVYNNEIWNMQDSGIAFMESMNGEIYDNDISDCRIGIRLSMGSAGNVVHDNLFDGFSEIGFNTYRGTRGLNDPTRGIFNFDRDGFPHDNTFKDNKMLNTEQGTKFKDSQDLVVTGNEFTGTAEIEFFDVQNTHWRRNTVPSTACLDLVTSNQGNSIEPSTFTSGSRGLPAEC